MIPVLAAVWSGCAPEASTDPNTPDPSASTPTAPTPAASVPWVIDDTHEVPTVDVAAVEGAVQDAIATIVALDPAPVFTAYRDLAAGADGGCPAMYDADGIAYWLDTCTSGEGTAFDGFGVDDTQSLFDGYAFTDVSTVGGVARIERSDGVFVDVDGYVQISDTDDGTTLTHTVFVGGDFGSDHPAVAGTWVADGLAPNVYVQSIDVGGTGSAAIVDGTLAGLPGKFPVVAFEGAILVEPSTGISDCGLEPVGSISVLGADGAWVDVVFDPVLGPYAVSTPDAAACDGCGRAWVGPDPIGTACFDFAAWL